jgi:hypothetical protein
VWFGIGEALHEAIEKGQLDVLQDMYLNWPFFQVGVTAFFVIHLYQNVVTYHHCHQHMAALCYPEAKTSVPCAVWLYRLMVPIAAALTYTKLLCVSPSHHIRAPWT